MGNEASSMRIHPALSAEDIKDLRSAFPGGGNGPPPSGLTFEKWTSCWPPDERKQLEKFMRKDNVITFHAYQEMAGTTVRGTSEDRVKLMFKLLDSPVDKTIKSSALLKFASDIIEVVATIIGGKEKTKFSPEKSCLLAKSLMHELIFPGEALKTCLDKEFPSDVYLDFDMLERWLVMKCPLFEELYVYALASSFGISVNSSLAGGKRQPLVPMQGPEFGKNTSLSPQEVIFLNHHLSNGEYKKKWRPLFNSRVLGESFAKFSAAILNKGPSLIIVWEENGNVFGAFASDSWSLGPKFYGSNTCFLFSLTPKMYCYESARFNTNYMYINLKQKTMPNGLGMGGQLEYFGFWLDSDYGSGRCAPTCSSFQSPQLSKQEHFRFNHLEVWGLGDEPQLDDEDGNTRSALDLDTEAQAVMEMMGKTFVSKDVKAQDDQLAKEQRDKDRLDQQN